MSWPSTSARPLVGIDDAADDADQCGLAGAIGPEQSEDLAARNVQIDALEGATRRGRFCQGFLSQDGVHGMQFYAVN